MDPYTIVKDEHLEIYDEFSKVKQECTTFQLLKEETNVQEDQKFNPKTTLPDKLTANSSTTHEGIASNSCSYVTNNIDRIQKHHKHLKSIDENQQKFDCNICDYKTTHEGNLVAHWKRQHCKTKRKVNLIYNTKTDANLKTFRCHMCDYATNFKHYLTLHLNHHTKEVNELLCNTCGYSTNVKGHLFEHLKIHSTVTELKCNQCDYTTDRKNQLKMHANRHLNIKELQCTECDYMTNYRGNLTKHVKKHLKDKRYEITTIGQPC